MMISKMLLLWIFIWCASQSVCALSMQEQFKQTGFVEMLNNEHGSIAFDALYAFYDELLAFLKSHPVWAKKLYSAKERFIRSKERSYYSTDFFGLYDESQRVAGGQVSFYYSTHFHEFICTHYPEFKAIPEIINFLQACFQMQQPYAYVFKSAADQLGLQAVFCDDGPSILLKIVKYLPNYIATRPHYDGTAFSLFLDSTDNQALLISPYKASYTVDDFTCPFRTFARDLYHNSMLLIPGSLLTEFSVYPTPHIVVQNGNIRYATIAFAMRPCYTPERNNLSDLPTFKH